MIYTLSLNPALDCHVFLDALAPDKINFASSVGYIAGGKGISVSKALKKLGCDNTALGFVGGFAGGFIENAMQNVGVGCDFVRIADDTRTNVKLKMPVEEFEIAGKSHTVTDENIRELIEKVKRLKSGDTLIMSGSIPESLPRDFYKRLAGKLAPGVRTVLDTRGKDILKNLCGNFLIKPNIFEFCEAVGIHTASPREIAEAAEIFIKTGAEHIIVSMGEHGAVYVNEHGAFLAESPKGRVVSTIGAGDSMVAGFLYDFDRTNDSVSAFKYASAFGSATAFSAEIADKNMVEELLERINITKLI